MGMIIDGISASQHLDSSGEILDISGHDISDLIEGKGVLNWEHNNDSSEDILGSIIYAKKIMKRDDCSNDRQQLFWDSCKTPFVYIKAELFDGEKHPGAVAAAAMIRYYHKNNQKILAGFSIEGSTLDRDENILKRSVGRRVALTLRPCNKSAISGVLTDSSDVKKYMNIDGPINTKVIEMDSIILEDIIKSENPMEDLRKAVMELKKTLTAGNYNVAPSQLTGGSALQVQDRSSKTVGLSQDAKKKLKGIITGWDKKTPLRAAIKAAMPEVSDDYVDHFTDLAEEMTLKKSRDGKVRIDTHHSWNNNMNQEQKQITSGLYIDPKAPDNHFGRGGIHKVKNDRNNDVMVKIPSSDYDNSPTDPSKNATAYYEMANDFFGLGENVPVTNYFQHPEVSTGKHHVQVTSYIPDATTSMFSSNNDMKTAQADGSAHKMALMDMVTSGDRDRHPGNILTKAGKIIHIDNDDAFDYSGPTIPPDHFNDGDVNLGNDMLHVDAVKWLTALDPRMYAHRGLESGLSKPQVMEGVKRLKTLQSLASSGKTISQLHGIINGYSDKKAQV